MSKMEPNHRSEFIDLKLENIHKEGMLRFVNEATESSCGLYKPDEDTCRCQDYNRFFS
jgi:hypothetical protein